MSSVDIFAIIRWWAVLLVIGWAVWPMAYTLLARLPDRGYAFSKMLGLLLVSYLFWMGGSLGFLANNIGNIVLSLVVVAGLSAWVYRSHGQGLPEWLREHRRYVLLCELVFALLFVGWAVVRANNPVITATEKPMEFAFLNSAGRSPQFPPLDPWLSGYAISYYYFGYVMSSVLGRLALVTEPVAFNLTIAWLSAGTGLGAFGLVYNLIALGRGEAIRKTAISFGLVAALALPLAGNGQMLLELLHGNGIGSDAFWTWLDVRDLAAPAGTSDTPRYQTSGWWWWRSSRVIHEYHLSGRSEEGLEPIAEFPGFSFILGDMHPHVLALPFAFLSIGVAMIWWQSNLTIPRSRADLQQWGFSEWGLLALTVLVLGGLSFLNTWDVLIHLFMVVGAYVLGQWQRSGRWHNQFLSQAASLAIGLVLLAVLAYLPFYIGFQSQAGAPFLLPFFMRPTRLAHFLIIFGMPLLAIVALLLSLVWQKRGIQWRSVIYSSLGLLVGLLLLMFLLGWLIGVTAEGSSRIAAIASELQIELVPYIADAPAGFKIQWGFAAVMALAPAVLQAKIGTPGVSLLLLLMAGLIIGLWGQLFKAETTEAENEQGSLPFALLLILTGTLLTLGPEFVYLRDNFGFRLNTIFKFYYQAWVVFGVTALFALAYLWQTARNAATLATIGYGTLLAVALTFPFFAATSRSQEYGEAPTLDGLAQLNLYNPDEYAAIMWLRENAVGAPVIVEAVGGQYSGFGRISASTGLPTILGWAGHEYQWRGYDTPEPAERDPAVRQIYTDFNWDTTAQLLNRYQVAYIYLGSQEVAAYGSTIFDKFANRLEVAYANNGVIIYRWATQE